MSLKYKILISLGVTPIQLTNLRNEAKFQKINVSALLRFIIDQYFIQLEEEGSIIAYDR
jgi:protein-L-isoaspartate O-methyltransferase